MNNEDAFAAVLWKIAISLAAITCLILGTRVNRLEARVKTATTQSRMTAIEASVEAMETAEQLRERGAPVQSPEPAQTTQERMEQSLRDWPIGERRLADDGCNWITRVGYNAYEQTCMACISEEELLWMQQRWASDEAWRAANEIEAEGK